MQLKDIDPFPYPGLNESSARSSLSLALPGVYQIGLVYARRGGS
jgi:hypothetical protein